ncbi:MAG TPA: circadian clock KaiB family protein [Opitutaceae bacterium]|nr:circadian clock KaiB family protein [Opitutaceae bacterium]
MKPSDRFKFLLYVAGDTPNSAKAVANLSQFCGTHLPGRHEFKIIDVFKEPMRALADAVFMTPMLIKLSPSPGRRIVGTLGQPDVLIDAMGVEMAAA